MKLSDYNYVFYDGEQGYWFNSISVSHFALTRSVSEKLEKVLDSPSDLERLSPSLYQKLIDKSFLIDDGVDELDVIRKKNREAVHRPQYKLTIMPTLNCNYKCWYCIQDHIPSIMPDEVMEKIKKHLHYMVNVKKIESLQIEWFGGEPFMFYHQTVRPLSLYVIELCKAADIPLLMSATSNGYYIQGDVAKELVEMGVNFYQITLDGNKENHDKVKFQKGCDSTFDHVLRNINDLIPISPDVNVWLRINYTNDNVTADIVDQVNSFISPENRKQIQICPHRVWQETPDPQVKIRINAVLDKFAESGYRVQRWNPALGFVPCYTSFEYYNTVNYNGYMLKCTACDDLYSKEGKGVILEDGSVEWADNFDKRYQAPSYENEKCLACKSLPLCMGLCPRDHDNGLTHCKYDAIDEPLETSIFEYLKQQYHEKE